MRMLLQPSSSPPPAKTPRRAAGAGASTSVRVPRVPPRGQSWHNNVNDRLTRKLMMLRLRHLHPVLAGTTCTSSNRQNAVVPSLVQRLEWMLYNAAHSMHEYTHEQSLERRVQALVTQLEPQMTAQERRREASKRERVNMEEDVDNGPSKKRQCVEEKTSDTCCAFKRADRSVFLLDNDDNLVGLVLSFLSGRNILRLRSVNHFMWKNAPRMVSTLHLETHAPALRYFSSGALTSLLLSCSKLTSLVVTSTLNSSSLHTIHAELPAGRTTRTKVHRRPSFSRRPTRRDSSSKNGMLASELLLRDIARALDQGACPELQELDLGSPLDYFAESDDVLTCLEAFAAGRQTEARAHVGVDVVSPFRMLRLDSTYLGDARLRRLADVFEQASDPHGLNCFGSLETLVLRSNFIGEAGCQALLRMLRCLPSLRVLDLSGNILTDLDAIALAEWIAPPKRGGAFGKLQCGSEIDRSKRSEESSTTEGVVQLRTLLVQDNFISPEGFDALVAALKAQ